MLKNRQALLFIGDIAMLALSFVIMIAIRFDFGSDGAFIKLQAQSFALLFILWIIVFYIFDLYNLRLVNPSPRNIGLLVAAMALNVILSVLALYIFSYGEFSPKTNLAIISSVSLVLLIAWRRIFYFLYSRRFSRSIGVVGTSPLLSHLVEDIAPHPHLGVVNYHWQSNDHIEKNASINLLIVESIPAQKLMNLSQELKTEILSLSDAYHILFGKIPLELMTDEKALTILTKEKNHGIMVLYRIIEVIISLIILIITLPFLLIAIIFIWIEDGRPFFYTQERVGKDGKIFHIYKLRSMKKEAEKDGAMWAEKNDVRVTKVGKVLRKTHIDEIPQMLNILKGDIALVGPRPERPEHVVNLEQEIPYYYLRHAVKPGFTGWAQIKFRYARTVLDSKEKFEFDLYYLLNKNPLLDFGIVLKTVQILFTH